MAEPTVSIPTPVLQKKTFLVNPKILAAGTAAVIAGIAYVVIEKLTERAAEDGKVLETPFSE